MPAMLQVIGGVTPVPLGVPEVLPNLNTGAIDVITAPALAAEQLQWASRLDTINTQVVAATIGALVFTKSKLDALPADLRAIMLDTGKVAAQRAHDPHPQRGQRRVRSLAIEDDRVDRRPTRSSRSGRRC